METKVCTKCKVEKEINLFNKNKRINDGLSIYCKDCARKSHKKWASNNQDKVKENHKNYYENNKEKETLKNKLWRENNRDKHNASSSQWKKNNQDKVKEYNKNYLKKYLDNNPLFKLGFNIRIKISECIRKLNRTEKILGCTMLEFKSHLQSQFHPWMNWDNYGLYNGQLNYGWDIDHIIPVSSAKTEEEVIKLNHYTNLQPLCSYTNRYIKKNKTIIQ